MIELSLMTSGNSRPIHKEFLLETECVIDAEINIYFGYRLGYGRVFRGYRNILS